MRLVLLFLFFCSLVYANEQKEVLLLHSYNKGLKWSDGISQGVSDVFLKHPEYELTTEYMDSKKIDSKKYFNSLFNLYKQKFSKRKYKVIIAADNYAYEFALSYHDLLFHDIPIVFTGVENFDKNHIPDYSKKYITGVVEYKKVKENLDLIKRVIPQIKTIYIISDNSFSSLKIKQQILSTAKEFKNEFKIIYDNEIDLNTIGTKLNQLPKNSAILFTSLYKDKFGKYIPYNKLRELFKSSKFPVFAVNKIHLGEGVIGGLVITPYEQGLYAAKKVFQIIYGEIPHQIKISTPMAKYYFDYNTMKKFNIFSFDLPHDAIIINKPETFFQRNRQIVDSAFLMLPIFILLIIILIINVFKQIKLEGKLIEQTKLDNVLLNNMKSSIFWKSKDDILLGCNNSLCELLNLSKDEIIGKHIKEIMPQLCKTEDSNKNFVDKIETKLYKYEKNQIDVLIRRKQYLNKRDEEAGVVTVITDVTDIKRLQLQSKKDEQFIVQRSKLSEIGEMMTSVAHQWKSPLVEISTIAQEILYKKRKKGDISEDDTKEFVNDIMTQIQYMTKTIDDFRAFIKPSKTQALFNINDAIEDLLCIIEHNMKYNYINIEVSYAHNDSFMIDGYANEFKQSILNIINNARDSIIDKRKTVDFQAKISINVYTKGLNTCINIIDNGLGIKENKLSSFFEPFLSSKDNGDGFGLYMAKLIIEDKMNGSIKAIKQENSVSILICIKNKDKD
ncbi:ABC transporter substrate binding protein [Sulfurimonas sp.]|uniref:ABC transporter substrate binding protein n=1 Tax=Sulfurimonas sp. TaxID=2022749 RepID=UPI0025DC5F77|nr:ABC transporter substrate binding protein [Sulfurimonas sp.]